MFDIIVADIIEQKVSIIANKPPRKGKENLPHRRMHIEEIQPLQILDQLHPTQFRYIRGKLAEMHLVENDFDRMM
jgi:hypothetical protein